jgi:hypothetical protein
LATAKKTKKGSPPPGGDMITINNKGDHSAIAAGRGSKAFISRTEVVPGLENWRREMERQIDAHKDLLPVDKTDLKENVAKGAEEVSKGRNKAVMI